MSRFGRDEGSVMVVLPLIVCITIGFAIMWNYAKLGTLAAQESAVDVDLERVAANMIGRVKTALAVNLSGCGGSGTNPDGATQFPALRNLGAQTAGPIVYNYIQSPASNTFDPCLLPVSDSTNDPVIGEVDLEVRRLGNPDRVNMSSSVNVVVRTIASASTGLSKKVTLSKTILLKAARLSDYVLVLKNQTNHSPQISISSGTQTLEFMSPVYEAHPTGSTLAIVSASDPSPIISVTTGAIRFDKPLSTRARAATGLANVDLGVVKNIFRAGIRLSVFDGQVNHDGLPFQDNGPTTVAWDQDIVYKRNGTAITPQADISTEAGMLNTLAGDAAGFAAYWAALGNQPTTYPDGTLFASAGASTTANPRLNYSCAASTDFVKPQLVFNQNHIPGTANPQTLTINMNDDPTTDGVVCGLINADTVVLNLASTTGSHNYFFVGTIYANQLQITGDATGMVTMINPYDVSVVAPLGLQTGLLSLNTPQTLAGVRIQFDNQKFDGTGRNMMLPIMRYIPPLESVQTEYRPGGMVTARYGTLTSGPFNGSAELSGGYLGPTSTFLLFQQGVPVATAVTINTQSTGRWPATETSYQRIVSTDVAPTGVSTLDKLGTPLQLNANDSDAFGDTGTYSMAVTTGFNDNFVFAVEETK